MFLQLSLNLIACALLCFAGALVVTVFAKFISFARNIDAVNDLNAYQRYMRDINKVPCCYHETCRHEEVI